MIAGNGRNCRLLFSDEVGGDFRRSDVTRLKDRYMHALTKSIFSNPLFFLFVEMLGREQGWVVTVFANTPRHMRVRTGVRSTRSIPGVAGKEIRVEW